MIYVLSNVFPNESISASGKAPSAVYPCSAERAYASAYAFATGSMWRLVHVAAWLCLSINAVQKKPQSVPLSSSPYDILGISKRATLTQVLACVRRSQTLSPLA